MFVQKGGGWVALQSEYVLLQQVIVQVPSRGLFPLQRNVSHSRMFHLYGDGKKGTVACLCPFPKRRNMSIVPNAFFQRPLFGHD